jgi:hypothetical protein
MMERSRREVLTGAAAIAATAAVPLPAIAAPVMPETDYSTLAWWDACELRAINDAFAGLRDGRFDAVVEH